MSRFSAIQPSNATVRLLNIAECIPLVGIPLVLFKVVHKYSVLRDLPTASEMRKNRFYEDLTHTSTARLIFTAIPVVGTALGLCRVAVFLIVGIYSWVMPARTPAAVVEPAVAEPVVEPAVAEPVAEPVVEPEQPDLPAPVLTDEDLMLLEQAQRDASPIVFPPPSALPEAGQQEGIEQATSSEESQEEVASSVADSEDDDEVEDWNDSEDGSTPSPVPPDEAPQTASSVILDSTEQRNDVEEEPVWRYRAAPGPGGVVLTDSIIGNLAEDLGGRLSAGHS